jgi:hypothetical protein
VTAAEAILGHAGPLDREREEVTGIVTESYAGREIALACSP